VSDDIIIPPSKIVPSSRSNSPLNIHNSVTGTDNSNDSELKLNKLIVEFSNFHKEFDVRMSDLNFHLQAVDDKVAATEHNIKTHFTQYKTKLQQLNDEAMKSHYTHIMGTASELMEKYNQQLNTMVEKHYKQYSTNMNAILDDMVNNIYIAGENAQQSLMNAGIEVSSDIAKVQPVIHTIELINKDIPTLQKLLNGFKTDSRQPTNTTSDMGNKCMHTDTTYVNSAPHPNFGSMNPEAHHHATTFKPTVMPVVDPHTVGYAFKPSSFPENDQHKVGPTHETKPISS
jgi:hypothetical protein